MAVKLAYQSPKGEIFIQKQVEKQSFLLYTK